MLPRSQFNDSSNVQSISLNRGHGTNKALFLLNLRQYHLGRERVTDKEILQFKCTTVK